MYINVYIYRMKEIEKKKMLMVCISGQLGDDFSFPGYVFLSILKYCECTFFKF